MRQYKKKFTGRYTPVDFESWIMFHPVAYVALVYMCGCCGYSSDVLIRFKLFTYIYIYYIHVVRVPFFFVFPIIFLVFFPR